jgi:hypothetical protein
VLPEQQVPLVKPVIEPEPVLELAQLQRAPQPPA